MKLVVLERNSVGTDIDVSCLEKFGEVTYYPNTVAENTAERVKDADIIVVNKAPLNETTLKDAPNVKLICLFATGFDNVDLAYCKSRGIKVANVVNYCTPAVAQHTLLLALALMGQTVSGLAEIFNSLDFIPHGIHFLIICVLLYRQFCSFGPPRFGRDRRSGRFQIFQKTLCGFKVG